MCTLIALYSFLPSFPIIALHNRYAPIDSHSKGTWIGFNEKGLFAAITDQHTEIKSNPYRSRGSTFRYFSIVFKSFRSLELFKEGAS